VSAPELLLPRLYQALANIVAAADAVVDCPINDEGESVEEVFRPIMRRLLLCQKLGQYSLLAIAGTQGAGKTTLIKSLYDLDGEDAAWLKPNEGRGEVYSILITEGEPTAPAEGFVWKLEKIVDRRQVVRVPLLDGTRTVKEAQQEFQRACSEGNAEELLVELRVPGKLNLGDRKGWLLLPGYEARTRDNETWQATMRAALAGASGSIIVTDETRLARDQSDLARDAISAAVGDLAPVVVVTKTEGIRDDAERLGDLEARAAEAFGVPARRVQCIGLADDPEYTRKWREELKEKIEQFVLESGGGTQDLWRSALSDLVRRDLKQALKGLNQRLRIVLATHEEENAQTDFLRGDLEIFDRAVAALRGKYDTQIGRAVAVHTDEAVKWMEKHLAAEFEGLKNNVASFFKGESERIIKLKAAVAQADKHAGTLAPLVAAALKTPIEKILNPQLLGQPEKAKALTVHDSSSGQEYEVIPWAGKGDVKAQNSPAHALVTLFPDKEPDKEQEGLGKRPVGLEDALKMLPAFTLERTRVASAMPLTPRTGQAEAPLAFNPLESALANLGPAADNARSLMRIVAATILAVDVAELGEQAIDPAAPEVGNGDVGPDEAPSDESGMPGMAQTLGVAVSTKAAAGLLTNPVFLTGTAIVAAGYLTISMFQEIRLSDRANRVSALGMLQRVGEFRHRQYMDAYDDTMESMRTYLEAKLRGRYRISNSLDKKDRIVHAIAVAQQLREEFADGLEDSDYHVSSLRV